MGVDGQLICIFGGGGFIGRYVAQHLLARGARVRIAQRHVKNAKHIQPLGNLGQVQFASTDITKKESVAHAVAGCDAAINLVGVFGSIMDAVNANGARNVAEAVVAAGCKALVHISAIGASNSSPSHYGRSKAAGEDAVRQVFPETIIMRPSIVFGREDDFINRFAGLIQMLPIVPVIGGDTKFQPVYVGDVAKAITEALENPTVHAGKDFELGGPESISMRELNRRIAAMIGRDRAFLEIPDFAAKLLAVCTGFLPGAPITADQHKMLQVDNVVSKGAHQLGDLDIAPTPLAAVVGGWMESFADHGRFGAQAKAS